MSNSSRLAGIAFLLFSTSAVAQRSDTTVVRVGKPLHAGVATLVEELTLGSGRATDEYLFTYASVFTSSAGVYVVDMTGMSASTVRQYDRSGRFVRTIGRNGQGPGEFLGIVGDVKELPDGRILLSDGRGILVFSQAGEPLARWSTRPLFANRGSPILIGPPGFIHVYGTKAAVRGERIANGRVLYRLRLDGTITDSLRPPESEFAASPRLDRMNVPFIPIHLTAWSPRGFFVTAFTGTYAVDLRRPPRFGEVGVKSFWQSGDPVLSIRRDVPVVPVQSAERDDWRQSITTFMRSGNGPRNWQWNGPDIPRVKPPISGLFVADDGRLWVRLSQPARLVESVSIPTKPIVHGSFRLDARDRWVEPGLYDVFEPTGEFVGQVRFPNGIVHVSIRGDTVWGSALDADGVPTVRRYRINWPN